MSKNPKQTLGFLRRPLTRSQGCAKQSLVSGNSAFNLPTITINKPGEFDFHLATILCFGPVSGPTFTNRNNSRTNSQHFPTQPVIMFRIISRIGQQAVSRQVLTRLPEYEGKLRRVLRRPPTNKGTGEQMGLTMTSQCYFWPATPTKTLISSAPDVIPTDMATFQAGGINNNFRPFSDEFQSLRLRKNGI